MNIDKLEQHLFVPLMNSGSTLPELEDNMNPCTFSHCQCEFHF